MQSMIARTIRHMPEMQSRYLTHDPVGSGKKRGFLVFTADKGLAGAYNHNVLKLAEEELEKSEEWNLLVVGELGRQYFAGKKIAVDEHFLYTAQHPTFDRARVITSKLLEAYDNGELDEIDIIFTSMKNGMQSETRMERLLPLTQQDFSPTVMQHAVGVQQEEFIFSPSPEAVLESIVPNYVTGYIFGADIRNGMTAVVSIKHPAPRFEGQTKTKLDNQDASKAVAKVVSDEAVLYFDRNLEVLKQVLSCAERAAKIRKTEEKAKTNMLTKQKYSFDSNGKLANCESRKPELCEIFIVEGDSAGGSAKMARNRNYQAIMPIRGKILNVEKASIDKVLANAEIKTMINAFGCGFSEGYGNDFDITKLRYDKIIIMADADVDGAHISTLLLTLFYRFMPELIFEGHVYIAMPPLYKAMPARGKEEYLYDDKALEKYRKTHKNFTLQRYKGLGEMDAEQLWETTLNPETRILKRVEIEDARMASSVTEMLMGSEVPPRRAFIYEHAQDAELDI